MADMMDTATNKSRRRNPLFDFFVRLVKEKPLGTIGAVIVLTLFITGIFADFLAPYEMSKINLMDRLTPPGTQYILGTDQLGRDMLTRIIFGARTSMIVGVVGTALSMIVSTVIGIASGFIGGKFDLILQRFVDAWMCFPGLLIIITIISMLGPGLTQVMLVGGLTLGIGGSRVIRSAVIAIKENVYLDASVAVGCSLGRILARHILPNVAAPIIILFSTRMGTMILMEAGISFLGFGIPPPTPSWGQMLSGSGREYMLEGPWMVLWPGLFLSLVVFGINMFGDAVRDLLDPRLRGGLGRYGEVKNKRTEKVSVESKPVS